eukprot:549459_1
MEDLSFFQNIGCKLNQELAELILKGTSQGKTSEQALNDALKFLKTKSNPTEVLKTIRVAFNRCSDNPEIQKSMKSHYDLMTDMRNRREDDIYKAFERDDLANPVELKSIPSKCIHHHIKHGSSKHLTKSLLKQLNPANSFIVDDPLWQIGSIASLCIQCIVEFVIQSNKFQCITSLVNNVCQQNISPRNISFCINTMAILTTLFTQNKLIKMFCMKDENVIAFVNLCKYLSSNNVLKATSNFLGNAKSCINGINANDMCFSYAPLLHNIFGTCKKHQFKIIQKEKFLSFLCDIVCSDIITPKTLQIDYTSLDAPSKFDLERVPLVREFEMLFHIYTIKYPKLISSKTVEAMLNQLQNWNCQTNVLAESLSCLDESQIQKFNEMNRIAQNPFIINWKIEDMQRLQLQNLNSSRRSLRLSSKMCFNYKCSKHIKFLDDNDNWNLKICSGCMIALYCNKQCQKYHWKYGHRSQCVWFQKNI